MHRGEHGLGGGQRRGGRRLSRRHPAYRGAHAWSRLRPTVPSYRVTAAVGLLQPGVAAPDVLPEAVATAEAMTTVEAHDVAVVRGQARVTVRFQADDDQSARRVGWAVLARLDELADISGRSVTRRYGSRWYPVRAQTG